MIIVLIIFKIKFAKMSRPMNLNFRKLEDSVEEEKPGDSIYYNKIPSNLKKTLYLTIFLLIIGIFLVIIGTIIALHSSNIQDSFSYYILSILCLIPGVYYTIQFLRAKKEQDEEYRREILDDIPIF